MAQKKSTNNNAKSNQIPDIPAEISWDNQSSKQPKYRGATMVANNLQHGAINFGSGGQGFAKNASSAQTDAFSIPSDISGGAIDISFGGNIKSSYPSMQPINFGAHKQSAPIIKVQVLADNDAQQKQKEQSEHAPAYDGFQPHNAHRSSSMNPLQMQQTVDSILKILAQSGNVDFYQKAPFAYVGRAFADHTDCEFMLNIYSDDTSESVVEIRRSSGECFEFGNVENSILKQLVANGAIVDNEADDSEIEDNDSSLSSFGFGFGSLPSLDSMDFDSNFSGTDVDLNDDQKKNDGVQMDKEEAQQIVQEAVDLDAMRDVLRSNIIYLNECMAKNEDIFKNVPDVISTILDAASGRIYDCWTIKSYLGMISKLISCSADIPSSLSSSIVAIKSKWSNVVKNEVASGVVFEFFPSQQIVRNCNQIIGQLQN